MYFGTVVHVCSHDIYVHLVLKTATITKCSVKILLTKTTLHKMHNSVKSLSDENTV